MYEIFGVLGLKQFAQRKTKKRVIKKKKMGRGWLKTDKINTYCNFQPESYMLLSAKYESPVSLCI